MRPDDGRRTRKLYCYVCAHPWRNLIDLGIHEGQSAARIWETLPVIPSVPLPIIPEIKRHQQRGHQRPKDVIQSEQAQKLKLLDDISDPVGAARTALIASPPALPPPPRVRRGFRTQLIVKPRDVLRHRQNRTGWTPEAQLVLRDLQDNRCPVCGASDPAYFDIVKGQDYQMVCGYLCQRCKAVVGLLGRDPVLAGRLQDYLLNPPSKQMIEE